MEELPTAQEALGLSTESVGGGPLAPSLVQPLVASLLTGALSSLIELLGDSLTCLPGLEAMHSNPHASADPEVAAHLDVVSPSLRATLHGGGGGGGGWVADEGGRAYDEGGEGEGSPFPFVSQADVVGAVEGLVRRMLEGALHSHHFAMSGGGADAAGGSAAEEPMASSSSSVTPRTRGPPRGRASSPRAGGSPRHSAAADGGRTVEADGGGARAQLLVREAQATSERLAEANGRLEGELSELTAAHEEVLDTMRQLQSELEAAREASRHATERNVELTEQLRRASSVRDALETSAVEERAHARTRAAEAAEAAAEAARRAADAEMRSERSSWEVSQRHELAALRAAKEAEAASGAEATRRAERLQAEKHALERERAALLGRVAAAEQAAAAAESLELHTLPRAALAHDDPLTANPAGMPFHLHGAALAPTSSADANESPRRTVGAYELPLMCEVPPTPPSEAASSWRAGSFGRPLGPP